MNSLNRYLDEMAITGIFPFEVSNEGDVPLKEVAPYIEAATMGLGKNALSQGILEGLDSIEGVMNTVLQLGASTTGAIGMASSALAAASPYVSIAVVAIAGILDLALDIREMHVAMSMFRRAKGVQKMVEDNLGDGIPFANDVATLSYTDCNRATNIRRRTVVTVQKNRAPWRNPGSFRKYQGNCSGGFKVKFCDHGEGNSKAVGAEGARCYGDVDLSSLLYPWWCGNGPPRPAPLVDASGSISLIGQKYNYERDPNTTLIVMQQRLLRDAIANALVPGTQVEDARRNLVAFRMGPRKISNAKETLTVTEDQINGAIGLCEAFLRARAGFARDDKTRAFLANRFAEASPQLRASIDPLFLQAVMAPNEPRVMVIVPGTIPSKNGRPPDTLGTGEPAPAPKKRSKSSGGLGIGLAAAAVGAVALMNMKK